MKFCQIVLYMYVLKVKKFQECTCLCLYVATQNIEGDENLHPPPKNKVKTYCTYLLINSIPVSCKSKKSIYGGGGYMCISPLNVGEKV